MKITKIILFFVSFILSFLFFMKEVFAVTFNWSDKFKLPGVVISDNIKDKTFAWKQLWDFNDENKINNVTSIACMQRWSDNTCLNYIVNVTKLFRLDLSWIVTYSDSILWEITLSADENWTGKAESRIAFKANLERDSDEKPKSIEFYYEFQWGKKTIHVFDLNQKCGTENEKICVIWLNSFFTYSAKGTTNWIYWTYSDFTIYNSATNKIVMNRIHKDVSEWIGVGWFQSLLQSIDKYKWGYWMRIADLDDGDIIYSMREDLTSKNKYKVIRFKSKNGFWYFSPLEDFSMRESYYNDKNIFFPYFTGYIEDFLYVWQFSKFTFDNSNLIMPYMNAYMWGDNYDSWYKNSIFQSLQDVFNFKWGVFTENNWTSTDPENFPSESKCETLDISCHIGDFVSRIVSWFSNFFSWFFDAFKNFTLWLGDKIVTFFKAFFDGLIYSIVEVAKEIWSALASVWNFIKVLFWDGSMYTFLAQNDKLSCWENWVYDYSWSLVIPGVIPGTKAHQVISPILQTFALAVPSIPHDGDVICTFAGYQRIKYKGNSPIDLILVMIFSFAILFLFTKRYGSNQ